MNKIFYKHYVFLKEINKLIEEKIVNPDNLSKMMPLVEGKIDLFLREKLSSVFIPSSVKLGKKTFSCARFSGCSPGVTPEGVLINCLISSIGRLVNRCFG